MKLLLIICFPIIVIFSCNNPNAQKESIEDPTLIDINHIPYSKKFKSKNIIFSVNHDHNQTETLKIDITKLKNSDYHESMIVKGEIIDGFILDLNNDSYPELYLIFKENNNSEDLKIYGVSTYKNKSAGLINVSKLDLHKAPKTDKIFKKNKMLVRTFLNRKNQMVKYKYELIEGEASYQLNAKRIYAKPNR